MRSRYLFNLLAALLIGIAWLLSGCGKSGPTVTPTSASSPSPLPSATLIPSQTPSPTPEPPLAILLAAPGADQATVDTLQTGLNDMVATAGLRWQVRQSLSTTDLPPGLRLVVVLPPDPGTADLAAAAPSTQFLALGIPGLPSVPNLTVIEPQDSRPDQQGFIAGVIASMLSADWRAGAISLSDTVAGRAARTGFLNGAIYFCGLCRPAHPPFYQYPLYFELPSTATTAEWQEAANYMVDHYANTVYVYPGAGDEVMLSILANAGVNIISSGDPPEAALSTWAVSLDTDSLSLIKHQVQGLLDGSLSGGQSLVVPIQFTHINADVFTPGKQRLAEQILSDLQAGYIGTGVDLTSGENIP